jgi:hypothetical protein
METILGGAPGPCRAVTARRLTDTTQFVVQSVAEFESALRSLERLSAAVDWADLQTDTVQELERRLAMMRLLHAEPSAGTLTVAEAQWLEVMQRFKRMLKAKAGFWRGWPHPIPRR